MFSKIVIIFHITIIVQYIDPVNQRQLISLCSNSNPQVIIKLYRANSVYITTFFKPVIQFIVAIVLTAIVTAFIAVGVVVIFVFDYIAFIVAKALFSVFVIITFIVIIFVTVIINQLS